MHQSNQYHNLPSAIQPIPHGPGVPNPLAPRVLETVEDSVGEESLSDSQFTECSGYECDDDQQPKPFNQAELNDLVRDLNLPKYATGSTVWVYNAPLFYVRMGQQR